MGKATKHVEVVNQHGEAVGNISEEIDVDDWRAQMGGDVGFLVSGGKDETSEGTIVDTPKLMNKLAPGHHKGLLVRKVALPDQLKRSRRRCEAWQLA